MNRRSVDRHAVQQHINQRGSSAAEAAAGQMHQGCGATTALALFPPASPASEATDPMDPAPQSWRQSRTTMSGAAILQLVPVALRQRLIAGFIDLGGGWPVSSPAENTTLLQYLVPRLPDPSHACSLCRMEVALTCASTGAEIFVEPEYRSAQGHSKLDIRTRIEDEAWGCIERALTAGVVSGSWDHIERSVWTGVAGAVWDSVERDARLSLECEAWQIVARSARNRIERGRYASLVWFHAEPGSVLRALHGGAVPPVGKPAWPVLFGPGIPNLSRAATTEEVELWLSLPADDSAPDVVERLLAEGIVRYTD